MSTWIQEHNRRKDLEADVHRLEREVRLMRQQHFRRLEERDALKVEKADLLTALESVMRFSFWDSEGPIDLSRDLPVKRARQAACEAIAKARGGE